MTTREILARGEDAGSGFIPGSRNLRNHVPLKHRPTGTKFLAVLVDEGSGNVYTGDVRSYKAEECDLNTET